MARQIAIIEDEPAIRANYSDALGRYGYEVISYASRPEASAAFALRLPDLVLIDIGLGDEPEGGWGGDGVAARLSGRGALRSGVIYPSMASPTRRNSSCEAR